MGNWKKSLREAGAKTKNTLDGFFKKVNQVENSSLTDRHLPKKSVLEVIDLCDEGEFPSLESSMKLKSKSSQKVPCSPMPNMKRTIDEVLSPIVIAINLGCKSPPAKIRKAEETEDVKMEIDEKVNDDDDETVDETDAETLTEDEIDRIISINYDAIRNGFFSCPIESCKYVLDAPRSAAKYRRRNVKSHLNRHKAERPFVCDEPGCSKKFTTPYALNCHKREVHPVTAIKCPMSECHSTHGTTNHMLDHLLFTCIQPNFAFCKECNMHIASRKRWSNHWTSECHKLNCELLERRGESISPQPTQDIGQEMKKAAKDPVKYKKDHCSGGLLGSVSLPTITTSIDDKIEKIQPFEGLRPTPEGSVSGVVWCSEMGLPLENNCHSNIFHNLLSGPQDKLLIPVTSRRPLGGPVSTIYEVPIVSSSTCTDTVFNYVITCRKHTPTQGTRGVGMVLDAAARNRFRCYMHTITKLKAAREKFEAEMERDITPQEFASLKLRAKDDVKNTEKNEWINCRKYRHFASKECSVENLVISIHAKYPQTKEGRADCILGEAYYQYAINSCDHDSGGLDEKPEYANHEKHSDQLIRLMVRRGQGTKKDQKKFQKTPA